MIKVNIKNKQNEIKWSANIKTQGEVDSWIAQETANKSWGKPERIVRVYANGLSLEDQGESTLDIINFIEGADSFGNSFIDYTLKAEYTIEQEDISLQIAAEKKISNRKKKRAFGEDLIDKIAAMNDTKLLNVTQVNAFMSDAVVSNLREHLYAGNIPTFVDILTTSDVSAFFSNDEKAFVIAECNKFLTSLEE